MQEIFNKRIDSIIDGLPGVAKSTDDFLAYAKTEAEHDNRLVQLLKRFEENRVTLNKAKCIFKTKQVEFLGHSISSEGIKPHIQSSSNIRVSSTNQSNRTSQIHGYGLAIIQVYRPVGKRS